MNNTNISRRSAFRELKQEGFTILEVLVSLLLLGFLLAAISSVLFRSTDATSRLDVRNDLLGETQLSQNYMVSKLREAAFVFPPSADPTVPATIQLGNTGYTTYNPFNGSGNYTWRLGVDPIVAFVVPPRKVTDGACAASSATTRADNCYAFYAFYALPRSQITTGVPSKSIAPASGPNFLGVDSLNDNVSWVLMEYRAYYTTQGYSQSRINIPTTGNAMALLDYVLPTASGEKLFDMPSATSNTVTISLATRRFIRNTATSISVPGSGRYTIRVYPRNLGDQLLN